MADAIASHAVDRAQALHQAVLALKTVSDLYMDSSGQNIDNMIYIVDFLVGPIVDLAEEVLYALKEGLDDADQPS